MMRLRTYAGISLGGAVAVIYHAFSSRGQFYPAMVYLSTSKISLVLLLNMGLVIMCTLWQLTKCLFLGSLREAEVERLNEQSWREVMEILFAITIFRQDFSVSFLAMVTALLFIKALHWLAQKRIEYIETTPTVPIPSHLRIVSFMVFLLLVDCLFLYSSLKYLNQTRMPSVSLFFSFEYMILATTTISTFIKYVFYVSDMLMEGQWEKKAVYTFYLELICDLLHLSMYLVFFLAIFVNYGIPLHLIRELYETFRNFKVRVADYIRYRKITSNMNDRFPDATPEELIASDATCIICREEMVTAKKLICGHIFHVHCLRSWLERQNTCPTCRALVVPSENGTSASAGAHGVPPEQNQPGGSGTSAQGSGESREPDNNVTQHQARLQAATAAAAIYEKSYVYPYANTVAWSPAYAYVPQMYVPVQGADHGENSNGSSDASTSGQQWQSLENHAFPQYTPYTFMPFQAANDTSEGFINHPSVPGSSSELHEKFLQHQIEVLQSQLQLLRSQRVEMSDNKGKATMDCPATVSDCGRHGDDEDVNT